MGGDGGWLGSDSARPMMDNTPPSRQAVSSSVSKSVADLADDEDDKERKLDSVEGLDEIDDDDADPDLVDEEDEDLLDFEASFVDEFILGRSLFSTGRG